MHTYKVRETGLSLHAIPKEIQRESMETHPGPKTKEHPQLVGNFFRDGQDDTIQMREQHIKTARAAGCLRHAETGRVGSCEGKGCAWSRWQKKIARENT